MFTALYFRSTPIQEPKMRLEIGTPGRSDYFEISPDARLLVFDLSSPGKSHLWLRPMDTGIARQLPETEDAFFPFWSPDSRTLGFFANSKLKRIEVAGGPAQIIADAPNPRGGAWNSEGTIVFNAASNGPLSRVSSAGGTAVPATRLEKDQGSHRYPQFLPDGRHFIYFALGKPEVSGVYVGSLDSLDSRRLMASESQAVYAHPGYLLFLRQELLLAQQFDANKLEFIGEPFPQAEHVGGTYTGSMAVSAASNGTIAYRTGAGKDSRLTWIDRSGKESSNIGPVGKWFGLALSPDDTRIATQRQENGNVDLWLVEVARGITTRLTTDAADDESPVWSPDGKRVAFDSNRRGTFDLYQTATGGAGAEVELLKSSQTKVPDSWSSDGRYLLFEVNDEKTGDDLWVLPLLGGDSAFPIANGSSDQTSGSFSPNNRWIAFESNESGRPEVYVQAFPEAGEKWQVSVDSGGDPQWRADGKEIFYVGLDGTLMAAPVSIPVVGKQIEAGKPVPLFHTRIVIGRGRSHQYAVTRNGQRFLLIVPVETAPPPITVLLNWAKR